VYYSTILCAEGFVLAVRYGVLGELQQAFTRGRMMSLLGVLAAAAGASVVANMRSSMERRWPTLLS
jgi:hypothetical protein